MAADGDIVDSPVPPPPDSGHELLPSAYDIPAGDRPAADERTRLAQVFTQIVADHLEMSPEAISETDDLRARGVDSIASLRIMQAVQARFGEDISMLAIIEHPTVAEFVDKVLLEASDKATPAADTESSMITVGGGQRTADDGPMGLSAPIYNLATGTASERPTLFCLPGDTGELTWALALLEDEPERMTEGEPVLGMESPTFRSNGEYDQSPRSIAARANECVPGIIAEGSPVRLMASGWAAVLAIEVARRLSEAGVCVVELVLVEPHIDEHEGGAAESHHHTAARSLARDWRVEAHVIADAQAHGKESHGQSVVGRTGMPVGSAQHWVARAESERSALIAATADWQVHPWVSSDTTVTVWGQATGLDRLLVPPPREAPAPCRLMANSPGTTSISAVPINPHGVHRRSFWCHSLLGDVSYALHLSRNLGAEYPVFGLEQFHLDGSAQTFYRVEEMAAAHVRAIRETDPDGPYLLGGYSMGGILAFECARQLIESGAEVRSLALIDPIMPHTPAWDAIETENIDDYDFDLVALVLIANALGDRWGVPSSISHETLAHVGPTDRIETVSRHLWEGATKKRTLKEITALVTANHRIITQNNAALERYWPRALGDEVPTLMLRASQGQVGPDNPNHLPVVGRLHEDLSNGFARFVGPNLMIQPLDSDHFSICDQRNIGEIASVVRGFWRS